MNEATQPGLLARLTLLEGGSSPQSFTVERFPCYIGRSEECEICLEESPGQVTVSRRHARLSLGSGRLRLEDLSTNGTTVGKRMLAPGEVCLLADHEEVWFGPKVRTRLETLRPGNKPVACGGAEPPVSEALEGGHGTAALRLITLGGFRAYWGESPIPEAAWETRKPILLLAYLAWHSPRTLSAERICSDLWPDNAQGGRQAMQSTLARLRRALKPGDPVLFERGAYRLNGGMNPWCDAVRLMEAARESEITSDRGLRLERLREVQNLYAGPFLEGLVDDWACLRRQDLEQQYLRSMGDLGELLLEDGLRREALELFRQVLQIEPCWEPGHQGMVRLLVESGQRDEAVRHYHRYVETMKSHMGLPASPEMMRLYYSLLEG